MPIVPSPTPAPPSGFKYVANRSNDDRSQNEVLVQNGGGSTPGELSDQADAIMRPESPRPMQNMQTGINGSDGYNGP